MFSKVFAVAVAATIAASSQALAWGDMYMGDGTHNPNSVAPQAYHGPNYCPPGLQPVVLGGVICCGTAARGYTPMKQQHVKKHAPKTTAIVSDQVLYTREQVYGQRTIYIQSE
ncbi:hypothetical protein [Planktotalea arctica]|uniref:hypothetical protein n=1 Tax=Planktotalea arctica TaxID=1481893 RepID=UPI00111C4E3B|nr:hypothetical protein [Planktotalea arctica]